jgi:hypothetical protein
MEIGHREFIQYCQTIAAELEERLRRMQMLVDYKLRSGTAFAEILRSFLDEHSAGKYNVSEGFIVNPFVQGSSSNHCDILVYDQVNFPLLDVEGDIKVVLPRAAAMVIEVEPYLSEDRLVRAFDNIRGARKVYPYITGIIFAFNGLEPEVLYQSMREHADQWHSATAPIAVINMDKGFIAHRSKVTLELGGGSSPFEAYELKGSPITASLEFLFLLYFDLQMRGMLAAGSLDKAWKSLMGESKANYLGKIALPK